MIARLVKDDGSFDRFWLKFTVPPITLMHNRLLWSWHPGFDMEVRTTRGEEIEACYRQVSVYDISDAKPLAAPATAPKEEAA